MDTETYKYKKTLMSISKILIYADILITYKNDSSFKTFQWAIL